MPSNPSAATLDAAWRILKHYPNLHWSLADLQNRLVFLNDYAVAVFSKVLDEAELLLIATHPKHLKQGYAAALLQSSLAELNVAKVFLEVRQSNAPARKLYEKLGFSETGKRLKYYRDGEDAILYALPINK